MNAANEPILRIPSTVREDVLAYRGNVERFLRGESNPVAFRAYRVPMGIYEQRTEGTYMVRIRIPAGLVSPDQLLCIAELSRRYGSAVLHVTTRQDIQIHDVPIEHTPDVLETLLEAGLSARGGGGNTVRNVSACPRAGLSIEEPFDVAPYAVATAEYLLQNRSSFNLPRKFKVAFSGCEDDCAYASVADLGFFAAMQDGKPGFAVYAGGGLGSNPRAAVRIEEFVPAAEVFTVAEAVKRLFDRHGDRSNKHRARLRYVLNRLGEERFCQEYRQLRSTVAEEGLPGEVPDIRPVCKAPSPAEQAPARAVSPNVMAERTPGRYTLRLRLDKGDITSDALEMVARIAQQYGHGPVRTTQLQDLLVASVAGEHVQAAAEALQAAGIDALGKAPPAVIACAGAATCKLGLCLSRNLADAINQRLRNVQSDAVIRISGCSNCCGHHPLADIGFQGRAQRIDGRLMPFYDVVAHAHVKQGSTHLAEKIGSVPARRVPDLLAEVFAAGAPSRSTLEAAVRRYERVDPATAPEELFRDVGSDAAFSLKGRGPGECGAGVLDVVRVDLGEAKKLLSTAVENADDRLRSEAVYRAITAAARSLLILFGLEPKTDREVFAGFRRHLVEPGWVSEQTAGLPDAAVDWRMGDRESLTDQLSAARDMVSRIEALFLSLNANLKFTLKPATKSQEAAPPGGPRHVADLRGVACPLNFVKAKLALEKIAVGETLEVWLDAGEPAKNVPASFAEQGQDVLDIRQTHNHHRLTVRRTK